MHKKEEYLNKEQFKLIYKNLDNILTYIQQPESAILKHERNDLVNSILWLLAEESCNEIDNPFTIDECINIKDRLEAYNNLNCREFDHIKVGSVGILWSRDGYYFFKFHSLNDAKRSPNLKSFLAELKFTYNKPRHLWFVKRFYSLNTINFTLEILLEIMTQKMVLDEQASIK